MKEQIQLARRAGVLYIAMGVTGMFGLLYVPSQLVVQDNPQLTAQLIRDHALLFRFGIAAQLTCQVLFVFLVIQLQRLFESTDRMLARQMVGLVVVSVPIAFVVTLNQLATLLLLTQPGFTPVFSAVQVQQMMVLFHLLYENGILIVQVFWGLWLIPFGRLAQRSRLIPAWIGFFLILGGVGYVAASTLGLLFPTLPSGVVEMCTLPSAIGELSAMLWLAIWGVRDMRQYTAVHA